MVALILPFTCLFLRRLLLLLQLYGEPDPVQRDVPPLPSSLPRKALLGTPFPVVHLLLLLLLRQGLREAQPAATQHSALLPQLRLAQLRALLLPRQQRHQQQREPSEAGPGRGLRPEAELRHAQLRGAPAPVREHADGATSDLPRGRRAGERRRGRGRAARGTGSSPEAATGQAGGGEGFRGLLLELQPAVPAQDGAAAEGGQDVDDGAVLVRTAGKGDEGVPRMTAPCGFVDIFRGLSLKLRERTATRSFSQCSDITF